MLIREKGYSATSVDELCAKAGVTKGAFFHHFPSKDALAVAAANRWSEISDGLLSDSALPEHRDPLIESSAISTSARRSSKGKSQSSRCLAGTMVQEVYRTHAEIRDACDASIGGHAAMVEADIAEAMKLYGVRAKWSAQSVSLHTQAVLQGAFILAKAKGGPEVAAASIDHLRRYIELLFRTLVTGTRKPSLGRREPSRTRTPEASSATHQSCV